METKSFEKDKDIAFVTASYLNKAVEVGILTTGDLSKASDSAIEELLLRVHKGPFPSRMSYMRSEDEQKLKTIFSSETLPDIEVPSKNEITRFVSGFIDFLKQERTTYESITGAIVYGSLLDKRRKPRAGSDLDIMFLVDMHSGWAHLNNAWLHEDVGNNIDPTDIEVGGAFSDITKIARKYAKAEFPKFEKIPVNLSHLYNLQMFEYALKPNDKTEPPWWLYSQGVYCMGGFKGKSEAQVNDTIQKALASDWLVKLKKKSIEDVRKNLKYDFGIY